MASWTDDRMDDLARRMDAGFARVDREIANLRDEIAGLRTEVKGDIDGLRTEVKGDIDGLRTLMIRFGLALMLGMFSVVAALIGTNAGGPLGG